MRILRILGVIGAAVALTVAAAGTAAAVDGRHLHVAAAGTGEPVAEAASDVTGRTVDAVTGRALPLVLVIAYEEDYSTRIGWAISKRDGSFRIDGVDEEFALRFVGVLTWHESGWLGCGGDVVPTPGESCTTSPGDKGDIPLDRR